ncbi:MAG: TetR/AcrR family transcriptional regulator [Candidatus Heimdallarchaeota archaeon]|nr:TetR/AcrR family transcriptional regulator [Candidatus Heimdallarchaeota archaeon]
MSKRQQQRESTRNLIISKAKDLFLSRGYLVVSTDQIAQASGVAKGTIFHHFSNKSELGLAVIQMVNQEYSEILNQLREKYSDDDEFLFLTIKKLLQLGIESTGLVPFILQFLTDIEMNSDFMEMIVGPYNDIFQKIFIKKGYDNSEVQLNLFFSLIDGVGLQLYLLKPEKDDPIIDYYANVILSKFTGRELGDK